MKKILFAFSICTHLLGYTQTSSQLNKTLTSDDSTALTTLASYPDSVRNAALELCQKPEVLIKAESLQKSTSQSFRDLTAGYTKDEQKKLWDLARYPGLLREISDGGKKSKEELDIIAAKYPGEIRPTIKEYGHKHYEVISSMNTLYANSENEFRKMVDGYPLSTQTAFHALLKKPDILNTLSNNMHMTVVLGEMYKHDPKQTTHLLDSVHVEHAKQSAKDLEEWKNGLEKDPQAKKEMEQAAREFSHENKDPDSNVDDVYKTAGSNTVDGPAPQVYNDPPVINNYYMEPYPYWFGYPWWFDFPYWYPYPYWYQSGFYWSPGGVVFVGFPSPFFMHWYLYHPYHHYYYPYFTDYCVGYNTVHYGPRNNRTGFNSEIRQWSRANEPNLPKGFFNGDPKRPERIKELGRFEMDYHNNTKGVFGKNITRSEFLRNNPNYYPHLNPVLSQPRFNQPVKYPQQQNPTKFNMERPGRFTRPNNPQGGVNAPSQNRGGFQSAPKMGSGGMRPHK